MVASVQEAAKALGVPQAQVRVWIRNGRLPAHQVSGRYFIEPADLLGVAPRLVVRPMATRMRSALMDLLSGQMPPQTLAASERRRLRQHLHRLREHSDPVALLAAWTALSPSAVQQLAAAPSDVPEVAADPRVRASGPSDPRSGLMHSKENFTGWVSATDVGAVVQDHFLVPTSAAPITLYISHQAVPVERVPLAWVIADLARLGGVRERERAREMLLEALPAAEQLMKTTKMPRSHALRDEPELS